MNRFPIFSKLSLFGPIFCVLLFAYLLSSCTFSGTQPAISSTSLPRTAAAPAGTPATLPCTIVGGGTGGAAGLNATITESDHILGLAEAPVTILVYSDFQCTTCALMDGNLKQLYQADPDLVRIVFRYFPLTKTNDKADLAIQAAEAAALQGKFWEMQALLFQKQVDWSGMDAAGFESWASRQAAGLGMDPAQFNSDFNSDSVKQVVAKAIAFASAASEPALPLLFINSTSPYSGPVDPSNLEPVVRLMALAGRQFTSCPPWQVDALRQYNATLRTSKGDVVIELYADKSPMAVNSFIHLARAGWYDGLTFYRVTSVIAQTGDPSNTGLGNPGYLFSVETPLSLKFDRPGMVALMNDGPETNGGRFFITLTPAPQLDGQYTIIGQVLSGMDVLSALARRDPIPGQVLPAGDLLIQVYIEEK
jgi:cyclophilin family peptidyl-prolyl cis-trans isomerase/protein-disulfide isomerase